MSSLQHQLRPAVAEFIGTFTLVFVGCGSIAVGKLDAVGTALAFGVTRGVMVYALGHISGGSVRAVPRPNGRRRGLDTPVLSRGSPDMFETHEVQHYEVWETSAQMGPEDPLAAVGGSAA